MANYVTQLSDVALRSAIRDVQTLIKRAVDAGDSPPSFLWTLLTDLTDDALRRAEQTADAAAPPLRLLGHIDLHEITTREVGAVQD